MRKKNCRLGKMLLALCLLLAPPGLAEGETGGLVAFQEEINACAFTPWWIPPSPKRP